MNVKWHDAARLPVASAGGAMACFEGELILAGGTTWVNGEKRWLKRVDRCDLRSGQWSPGPPLPGPSAYAPYVQGKRTMEILGGFDGCQLLRVCVSLEGCTWSETGPAPPNCLLAAGVRAADSVFIFGGCANAEAATGMTGAVLRRESGGGWREVGHLPGGPLVLAGAASRGDAAWLFGGLSEQGNQAGAFVFHLSTGEWDAVRPLPGPCRGVSGAVWDQRSILLVGGFSVRGLLDSVWLYDTVADRYTPVTPLPAPLMMPAVVVEDRTIYVCGGEDGVRSRSGRTFVGTVT